MSDTTPGLLSSDLSLVREYAHVVLLACVYCLLCKGAHYPDVALHFRAKTGEIAPMRFILLIAFTHGTLRTCHTTLTQQYISGSLKQGCADKN